MFNIILFQPEIPQNTGNIIRLCANTRCNLYLVKPLGFDISEKSLKRAALDHIDNVKINVCVNLQQAFVLIKYLPQIFIATTKAYITYSNVQIEKGATFIFGSESKGLPDSIIEKFKEKQLLRIPICNSSRSLNLANSVSIFIYEAFRQNNFIGLCK